MDFPNLGSFFKNPILSTKETEKNEKLANLKRFELPDQKVKFSAGEMLDKLNLKGMNRIISHEPFLNNTRSKYRLTAFAGHYW